jgi:hypothetical protein
MPSSKRSFCEGSGAGNQRKTAVAAFIAMQEVAENVPLEEFVRRRKDFQPDEMPKATDRDG